MGGPQFRRGIDPALVLCNHSLALIYVDVSKLFGSGGRTGAMLLLAIVQQKRGKGNTI
jgi:hypothetical protein